ncbi:MAG TPA: hypothetical protein VMZ91_14375, partial [Candidatus Paceibacterota bacterium]|nr:hypothetical protein [Candidatus Paceibacterota bacterium]
MRKINKKGDEKYYILMSFILGLIIVAIVLYFLFHEYFTKEDIDWETCKQSILLRATAPEFAWKTISLKDNFPLKCKTEVINIDYEDTNKTEKEFADALVNCFSLSSFGKYQFFPSTWFFSDSSCLVCTRIHINQAVMNHYVADPINFKNAL